MTLQTYYNFSCTVMWWNSANIYCNCFRIKRFVTQRTECTEISIKSCMFSYLLTGYCGTASAGSMGGKIERGIYYPVLKFTPKELAFHRSCTLTFPTAKNVIEGLRQRNPVVFNQAFKIFDISSDVATGWHPED